MYQHILVPIDGSVTSREGLAEAIGLAKLTGGQLRLIHVIDELSVALTIDTYMGDIRDWRDELRDDGLRLLEEARNQAVGEGVAAEIVLRDTFRGAMHEVLAEAAACHADLIVIGTHGRRGVGHWVMGSAAEQISRMSPVPVLLVRASAHAKTQPERLEQAKEVAIDPAKDACAA